MSQLYTLYFGENFEDEVVVNGDGEIQSWSLYSYLTYEYVPQARTTAAATSLFSDNIQQKIQEELIYQKEQLALRASELQGEDDNGK